jgi:hypothetical protein
MLSVCACKNDAWLINEEKVIPVTGAIDTLYFERSKFWDTRAEKASVEENRQEITFVPLSPKEKLFVVVQNMGGVPLRRDTIRTTKTFPAETFLRTFTKDTNLRIHVEFTDWKKTPTDVVVYIRHVDSIYRSIRFEGAKAVRKNNKVL